MKKESLYNIGIGILLVAIAVVVVIRFILPEPPRNDFSISDIENLEIIDLNKNHAPLTRFLAKDEINYVLLFELTDCYTCLVKGLEDLKKLKSAGKNVIGLAVHDLVDEVDGWSAQYELSPILVLPKVEFYEHIATPMTPAIVVLKNNEVESVRYILP